MARQFEFHKMHGAGNDFVLIDARAPGRDFDPDLSVRIADRHLGVGCDQVLVLRPPSLEGCLLRYEIWNADGSPAGQCGNGARCVGLFLALGGETGDAPFSLESPSGPVILQRCADGEYEVGMGVPEFSPDKVPHALEGSGDRFRLQSPWGPLEIGAVSMGNPHALLQVDDITDAKIPELGAWISTHADFPQGCNAGFAQVLSPDRIRLRVVERGAGETLACGSGACAAVAILRRAGVLSGRVRVDLPGGRLVIEWPGVDRAMTMKGPAEHVFRGTMNE